MRHNIRWPDEAVISWADLFTSKRMTLMEMEVLLEVSHSTLWWCFIHRLPHIDMERYDKVTDCLINNIRNKSRKEK